MRGSEGKKRARERRDEVVGGVGREMSEGKQRL